MTDRGALIGSRCRTKSSSSGWRQAAGGIGLAVEAPGQRQPAQEPAIAACHALLRCRRPGRGRTGGGEEGGRPQGGRPGHSIARWPLGQRHFAMVQAVRSPAERVETQRRNVLLARQTGSDHGWLGRSRSTHWLASGPA